MSNKRLCDFGYDKNVKKEINVITYDGYHDCVFLDCWNWRDVFVCYSDNLPSKLSVNDALSRNKFLKILKIITEGLCDVMIKS